MILKPPVELVQALKDSQRVVVATHINPDGDALGSALGLVLALRQMGKQAWVVDKDPVPRIYRFLPSAEEVSSELPQGDVDTLVLVDCGEMERTGYETLPGRTRLVIDHHLTERNFGDIRWVLSNASSTGEMVFNLLKALGLPLEREVAVCLYVALFTDTGGFRYSSSCPSAYRAAAEMVEAGAEPWEVTENVYESHSYQRLALLGKALDGMVRNEHVAIIAVTDDMYEATGATSEDTDNFANMARSIEGIEVGIFLRQVGPDAFKASMRSKGRVNVAAIAERFGGGGHHNAAGGVIEGSLEHARATILKAVEDALGNRQSQ